MNAECSLHGRENCKSCYPILTADEFERGHAERSRRTVAELRAAGRVVVRCACGDDTCEGWASVNAEAAAEDYAPGGIYHVNETTTPARLADTCTAMDHPDDAPKVGTALPWTPAEDSDVEG